MKLADESVAKALGWYRVRASRNQRFMCRDTDVRYVWEKPDGKWVDPHFLPAFTTSLDIITAELRRLKIGFEIIEYNDNFNFPAARFKGQHITYVRKTAPLALCAALLAYLKEKK